MCQEVNLSPSVISNYRRERQNLHRSIGNKNALPFVISMPSVKINQMPDLLHTQGTKMGF